MNLALKLIYIFLIAIACSNCTVRSYSYSHRNTSLESHWAPLSKLSLEELTKLQHSTQDSDQRAWVALAIYVKQSQDATALKQALERWKQQYPQHEANAMLNTHAANFGLPKNIAVLLPLSGENKDYGLAVQKGILTAYYQKPSNISLHFYDTAETSSSSLYNQALASGTDRVIGPLMNEEIDDVISHSKIRVPTLTLNLTSRWSKEPLLFGLSLSLTDLAQETAYTMAHSDYHNIFAIVPNNPEAKSLFAAFQKASKLLNMTIVDMVEYEDRSSLNQALESRMLVTTEGEKEPQRRRDIDSIFLIADPTFGRQAKSLLNYYFAYDLPTYSLYTIYAGAVNPQRDHDLEGILFADEANMLTPMPTFSLAQHRRYFNKGFDAYYAMLNLDSLLLLPGFNLSEGNIQLNPDHTIQPEIKWFQFQKGTPRAK